jgi:hypothetical protein
MTRPKSEDPKLPVTLRLPTSVLARWQAGGDDWRPRMEAALCEAEAGAPMSPKEVLAHAQRIAGVDPVILITTGYPKDTVPAVSVHHADPRTAPKLDTSMVPVVDLSQKRPAYQRPKSKGQP